MDGKGFEGMHITLLTRVSSDKTDKAAGTSKLCTNSNLEEMFVDSAMDRRSLFPYQDQQSFNCKVTLQNRDLWQQFHDLETEMIITKSGRRLFPALRVQVENLDPNAQYCVMVEMVQVSKHRFKYASSSGWTPAGAEEAQSSNRVYVHPDSPSPGYHWMSQVITFGRMKLTNTTNPPTGHLVLSSMHKYQPRIMIVKSNYTGNIMCSPIAASIFPETEFVAVTAYQNDKITKLKIDNNPFAKGFRENGQSKCKRKREISEETEIDVVEVDSEPKRSASESSEQINVNNDSDSDRTASPESAIIHTNPPQNILQMYPYPQPTYDYYYPLFYHPYYLPPSFPHYPPYRPPNPTVPQVLGTVPKPTKITDFSIRSIMGIS